MNTGGHYCDTPLRSPVIICHDKRVPFSAATSLRRSCPRQDPADCRSNPAVSTSYFSYQSRVAACAVCRRLHFGWSEWRTDGRGPGGSRRYYRRVPTLFL